MKLASGCGPQSQVKVVGYPRKNDTKDHGGYGRAARCSVLLRWLCQHFRSCVGLTQRLKRTYADKFGAKWKGQDAFINKQRHIHKEVRVLMLEHCLSVHMVISGAAASVLSTPRTSRQFELFCLDALDTINPQ